MKKKITALLIISIFMLSMIPLAFAQRGDDAPRPVVRQTVRSEIREEVRDLADNATREEIRQEVRSEIRERIQTMPAPRTVAAAQLVRARTAYVAAKENFEQSRDRYMEQRMKFNRAKEAYKECKGVDSEDCNEKRSQLKQNAKPHLEHAADLVIKELERVRAKIESSEDLSEDEIAEMTSEIDELISSVEDAKETVSGLDDDAPSEEYNAAVRQIREAWAKTKPILKRHAARLSNARLGNIIHQTEILEKRLYNAVDKLEEQGKDVSELEGMMDDFSAKLDEAADKYQEARAIWSDANTPGEIDEAAKEIHELMKEAQAALKEARDMLRLIVGEIKAQNRGSLDVVESEDESEDETEVEESEDETEEEEESEDESEEDDSCEVDTDCDSDEFCDEGECEDLEEESDEESDDEESDESEEDTEDDSEESETEE